MKTLDFISILLRNCKVAEPIENKSDYTRVKNWVKRATKMYKTFTILASIIVLAFLGLLMSATGTPLNLEIVLVFILFFAIAVIFAWGIATMLLNSRNLIKSMWNSVSTGYRAGEKIEKTSVDVRYEYDNTYSVRTRTDNEGCLFAVIFGFINWIVWFFLCMYVCPYLSFRKIKLSKENLKNFESQLK